MQTPTRDACASAVLTGFWLGVLLVIALLIAGCAVRTIYIPYGEPVRLREPIRNAKVWVADKSGKETPGEMDLPEGWYCLPDTRK